MPHFKELRILANNDLRLTLSERDAVKWAIAKLSRPSGDAVGAIINEMESEILDWRVGSNMHKRLSRWIEVLKAKPPQPAEKELKQREDK